MHVWADVLTKGNLLDNTTIPSYQAEQPVTHYGYQCAHFQTALWKAVSMPSAPLTVVWLRNKWIMQNFNQF